MKLQVKIVVFVFGLLLGARVFAAEPPIIGKIKVAGNVKIETDAVLSLVKSRQGSKLDSVLVTQDIKNIYAAGYFEDVKAAFDKKTGLLTYTVKEKLTIRKIKILGNKKIDTDDIKKEIKTKEYSYLNVKLVKDDIERLRKLYDGKGYYLAKIDYEVKDLAKNEVELTFRVEEEKKVLIKRINFLGNTVYRDSELKKVMMTKEGGFWSFISDRGTFKSEMFDQDRELLRMHYGEKGYINAKIGDPRLYLSRDMENLYLNITIEEGKQYRVGKVRVSGDLIRDIEELEGMLTIKEGEIANTVKIRSDMQELTSLYSDDGYAYANIIPHPIPKAQANVVDIDFNIQKGDKVYIERINIKGNTSTRDKVIRRELQIKEGDLYSLTKMKESYENLERLGYFESVKISTPVGSSEDKMIINITVEEKSTGAFQVGVGFNSLENFQFIAQLQKRNLFGYGWDVALTANLGGRTRRFNLYFVDYWFLDSPVGMRLNLYNEDWTFIDFDVNRKGGSIGFDFPLYRRGRKRITLSSTYGVEVLDYSSLEETVANLYTEGTLSKMTFSLSRDTRNRIFEPTQGSYLGFDTTIAGGFLGGGNSYAKFEGEWRQYLTVSKSRIPMIGGAVVQFHYGMGYVMPLFEDTIPLYQKYFPGGIYTIRGFELRSLSPTVPVATSSDPSGFQTEDFRTGGNKQVIFNVEYLFPIFGAIGIKGVFFFDMGNAFASGENINLLGLRKSVGFGIRWFSPMGPLRFEWGFPLDKREDESTVVFDFTIGSLF